MSSTDLAALAGRIASLERLVTQLNRSSRLGQSSIEGGAIQVYDTDGTHRASLGVQEDGTVGLTAVNGPTPPTPSLPQLSSVLGGVAAAWDGTFADGDSAPLDWTFTEVHASPTAGDFTPDASTLRGTIATVFGGTLVVPADAPVWVRLVARTTSGVASDPSDQAGPVGPAPVVAQAVLDGIVSDLALADGAVTAAKLAVGAVDAQALADGAVTAAAIGQAAVTSTALATGAVTTGALAAGAVTAGKLAAGSVTAGSIAAGAVTAGSIAASSITGAQLAAATILATNLAANSVAAGTIAANAITGREIAALAITADKLSANSVTAAAIAAGTIDATKLVISGIATNIVPDPGFETAAGAALVAAAGSSWSLDTSTFSTGTRCAKFSATAAAATTADMTILKGVPVTGGDQVFVSGDWRATALTGSSTVGQKLYLRWRDAAGVLVAYSVLTAPATLDGTWRTMSGTFPAPSGAVTFDLAAQAYQYLTASLWWDNIIVRPMVGSTQIQAGAIQTGHLSATAIDGMTINGVNITGSSTVTGKTLQTATSGNRVVLSEAPRAWGPGAELLFYSEVATDEPGSLICYGPADGAYRGIQLTAPNGATSSIAAPALFLSYTSEGTTGYSTAQLQADRITLAGQTMFDLPATYNDGLGGAVLFDLIQDWTTPALASGYTANGNSQGVPQYRIINWLGTEFAQWRGGVALTYPSGSIANSGALLKSALPAVAQPSSLRTCCGAVSQTGNGLSLALKVDFTAGGAINLVGTTTTYQPTWVSFNGIQYTL